jgi:catechol 2,3-dioxygenase-like lactoylglutathione lyase family enzyme
MPSYDGCSADALLSAHFTDSATGQVTLVTGSPGWNERYRRRVAPDMGIFRLNHAVLYVRDLDETVGFYRDVLGFQRIDEMTPDGFAGAAFLRAPGSTNDHDLGLFEVGPAAGPSGAGRSTVGLYHLAWEVDTLDELERTAGRLAAADALVGASDHGTTKSLYGRDPNGIEFEIVWLIPADLLDDAARDARRRISPLDLAKEKARYGADTRGGIGISVPAAG